MVARRPRWFVIGARVVRRVVLAVFRRDGVFETIPSRFGSLFPKRLCAAFEMRFVQKVIDFSHCLCSSYAGAIGPGFAAVNV